MNRLIAHEGHDHAEPVSTPASTMSITGQPAATPNSVAAAAEDSSPNWGAALFAVGVLLIVLATTFYLRTRR